MKLRCDACGFEVDEMLDHHAWRSLDKHDHKVHPERAMVASLPNRRPSGLSAELQEFFSRRTW